MPARPLPAAGCVLVAVLCLALTPADPALAQSPYLDRGQDRSLLLEVLKPSLDGEDPDFVTSTWFLGTRFAVSPQARVVFEFPFAVYKFGDFDAGTVGNPYLGVEFGAARSGPFGELGVRPPISADEYDGVVASLSGILSDVDRWEAFWPNVIPVTAAFNYRHEAPTGFRVRGRLGGSLWIPEEGGDIELFVVYGGWAGYEGRVVRAGGGWSGRVLVTDEGVFGTENLYHQLSASVDVGRGRVRPGAHLRLPLNSDLTDAVNLAWGVSLGFRL